MQITGAPGYCPVFERRSARGPTGLLEVTSANRPAPAAGRPCVGPQLHMRRNRYIVLLVAAVASIVVAVLLGTGVLSGKHGFVAPSGVSPACLPATLHHSARLAGTSVEVSPAPGTGTASPGTQISFIGSPLGGLGSLAIEGSRRGRHDGRVQDSSQGDGASFGPNRPFAPGERVLVSAALGAGGSAHRIAF